jgi:YidC/Oxa1 family membrane protein insertase
VNPLVPIGNIFHAVFYEPVYNVLMLVYHTVGVFALAVIIVTLLLRACLIPLTRKQLKSSREMQVLQPKLKELQQQYRGDPQRLMEEQRRLYKEHGVSPLSGCLPLLVQMPVLYALYFSFYTVLPGVVHKINQDIYPFLPHIHAAPNLHFLWMNLGQPDPIHLLPILAGALTFMQLRMAMPVRKQQAGQTQDPTTQATSMMQWIMPFMTIFIGWRFYSGLALYWTISTGFSVAQQYFINGRNLGSLFLGVPGLEHLVPAPKEIGTQTVAGGRASYGRALPAASAAVVPATSTGGSSGGGLRGLWRQLREAAAVQQSALAETQALKVSDSESRIVDADPAPGTNGTGGNAKSATERRNRPPKNMAKLVKPVPSDGAATEAGDATDEAIRAGTDTSVLPEQAVAKNGTAPKNGATNGATSGAIANGASPQRASNGHASGQSSQAGGSNRSTSTARAGTAPRKTGAGKGQSGSRPKGGRPKGGR